ncbi:DUF7167 family protein [Priestia megaterium]|uniref:DUF7167 family protein n=1 Tax=Priestia megaterium TaxID=1404 RepID=UPI002877B33F|nr:hypothetical protein [Priestia megaterium]
MSERKVRFSVGIGITNAEREEVFTLSQLGISEEDYETEEELQKILDEELKHWINEFIDSAAILED